MGVNFNGNISYQTGEGNRAGTPSRTESPPLFFSEPLVPSDAVFTPTEEPQASDFSDILYLTGTASFWLLPQEAVDQLEDTADELSGLLDPDHPESSISHLADKLRLLDALQPLHMKHFLNQEKLQEFESIMQEWNLTADDINFEAGYFERVVEYQARTFVNSFLTSESQRTFQKFRQDQARLRSLYNHAKERAEGLGYSIEGSALYRPKTEERHKAI